MILTFQVKVKVKFKVKVKEVKVQNLIISILGQDKTCLKFWTTLQQNCGFDLKGQGQGQGGQGPKFNNFYSKQRWNLSEILDKIASKL